MFRKAAALALSVSAVVCQTATFPVDVVQFWCVLPCTVPKPRPPTFITSCRNAKTALAIGASVPPLASSHAAYAVAYVHSAILQAATACKNETLPVQQIAVSIAAHDTLQTLFLAQYETFYLALKSVKDAVKLSPEQLSIAHQVGTVEAIAWTASRLGDGVNRVSLTVMVHATVDFEILVFSSSDTTISQLQQGCIRRLHRPSLLNLLLPPRHSSSLSATLEMSSHGLWHHQIRNSQVMRRSCRR
jgi:hypothetical protein